MKVFREDVVFQGPVRFNIIPTRQIQDFVDSDTTPSVLNNEYFVAKNIGAVTITQFDDGGDGQDVRILGDGFTSVDNNAFIKTKSGAATLLDADKVYTFVRINSVWYETT